MSDITQRCSKKPVTIDAVQLTAENMQDVMAWVGGDADVLTPFDEERRPFLLIPTLEGNMTGQIGDYIIRGVKGEFYPCKPDIFAATYTPTGARQGGSIGPDDAPTPGVLINALRRIGRQFASPITRDAVMGAALELEQRYIGRTTEPDGGDERAGRVGVTRAEWDMLCEWLVMRDIEGEQHAVNATAEAFLNRCTVTEEVCREE